MISPHCRLRLGERCDVIYEIFASLVFIEAIFAKPQAAVRIMRKVGSMRTVISIGTTLFVVTFLCSTHSFAQISATQPNSKAVTEDLGLLAAESSNLSKAQVQALEAKVKTDPDDLQSRARLLGFYFLQQQPQAADIAARREQILWVIGNHPNAFLAGSPFCRMDPVTDAEGYATGKALWIKLSKKPSPPAEVIENAVQFLAVSDQGLAKEILERVSAADPNNPLWHKNLAEIYSNSIPTTLPTTAPAQQYAQRALEELERAFVLTIPPEEKFYILTDLPKAAMACGDKVKTTDYAKQLLAEATHFKTDWNYGNAIHQGNLALGRVALASGDIETAKARLLDAGKTPGSPQLNSFGPNMELARKLLVKGQKDNVLQYFDLCRKFWKMGHDKLDAWRTTVNAGQIPDFGANLVY